MTRETKMSKEIKEYREMKETIANELEDHINIAKRVSQNLSDIIINATKMIIDSYREGGKIILIGNGGSASDAQHIAAEFIGRLKLDRDPLPAIALTTNISILTALANDYGYDTVFSRQLNALSNDKDIIIAITTSGNSQNIIEAVRVAKLKNIKVIGLTGKTGGKLKDMVDILINVPSESTLRIQEMHITIGHIICDLIEKSLIEKNFFEKKNI